MAGADDRDPGLGDRIHIPSHIENQRWIVDLFQLCGVGGIIHADDGNTSRRMVSGQGQAIVRRDFRWVWEPRPELRAFHHLRTV